MITKPKMKVLVTGGNGHVGFNICKELKEHGYEVVATVRNIKDPIRTDHLSKLGIQLIELDLLRENGWNEAMAGVEAVFHSAAPNIIWAKNPKLEIIDPAVLGMKHVFKAANLAGVKTFIFTSSCSTIGFKGSKEKPLTENDWNLTPQCELLIAKLSAEQLLNEMKKNSAMRVVSLHPSSVYGPGIYRLNSNLTPYKKMLEGRSLPFPNVGFTVLDVRDLATAHRLALENERASGRYIIAGKYFSMPEYIQFLRSFAPRFKLKIMIVPDWLLFFAEKIDFLLHKVFGRERELTSEMMKDFLGMTQYVSDERAKRELGFTNRPVKETMNDTLEWISQHFVKPS